jgi:hypothetical protein
MQVDAPALSANVPRGHAEQRRVLVAEEKEPGRQFTHSTAVLLTATRRWPGGHVALFASHRSAPVPDERPLGHAAQLEAPITSLYVLGGHCKQATLRVVAENVPRGQTGHAVAPEDGLKRPSGHSEHEVAPTAALKEPGGHAGHAIAPVSLPNEPSWHGAHVPLRITTVPVGHTWPEHEAEPGGLTVPSAHGLHSAEPSWSLKKLAGHIRHSNAPSTDE